MDLFKKLNNYTGWGVFLIASFVYLSTIEQTVSFWDCGEYIATAYKLEVGHPPGAPFFQLFGRIFTLFATQGTSEVAVAINVLSAMSSSFTILFLFWTITAFSRKLFLSDNKNIALGRIVAVLGSGAVGALAYTFSDSFWFSAVEGEVYAMSSFFTAVTFWCIMKWEQEADKPHASRWLVLIAYLIGLSIGVHLLSLLAVPAMGMIYYAKKYDYTRTGAIKAFILSTIMLGLVQGVIIPGTVSLISKFEMFFVNTIGMPFNSGTIIYFLAIIGAITFGLIYTKKHNKPIWNTAILGMMMLLIGYSSFVILVVRSNANPPIDENNPESAVELLSYLKREQYGDWPILYGQHFNAKLDSRKPYIDGTPIYEKDEQKGKYVVVDKRKNAIPNYREKDKMFFPRIWSATQARHAQGYVIWAGLKNKDVTPTLKEHLTYFFKYQVGWSYLRYFMWNFVGRQNDYMNMDGNSLNGNWESGIKFVDNARLGTPSSAINMPNYLQNNKGKNHYYFLPLILGLIGMFFHFKNNQQDAISVLLFFIFTGVAIIVYLNIAPFQPRERDYAFVGSFYAFSIWIGLSVLAIYEFISKHIDAKISAYLATLIGLAIPALMAAENWDDHDRGGRFTAIEVAKNYLNSCDKNAIIFTNGDNDTFPLWYAQEVEGIRTDIKVVNLSLFNTDWYIDQMKRASYDAAPIPSSLEHNDYRTGTRDYTPIQERIKEAVEVKSVVEFINSNNPKAKLNTSAGLRNYCPTKNLKLKVNKEAAKTFVPKEYHELILDEINFKLNGSGIFKNKLLVLDILANFNWERPIYFAITVGRDNYMGLENYFQLEGLAYRLVPYATSSVNEREKNPQGQTTGIVHTEKMYERLMNQFKWGGLNNPSLYFDETNTRMVMNFRNNYSRLAESLFKKGEKQKAISVLDRCIAEFPHEVVNLNYFSIPIIDLYYKLNETEKGGDLLVKMIDSHLTKVKYLKEFDRGSGLKQDVQITSQILGSLTRLIQIYRLEDSTYEYFKNDGKYYKKKAGEEKNSVLVTETETVTNGDTVTSKSESRIKKEEIEIDYTTYRINTFTNEYLSIR